MYKAFEFYIELRDAPYPIWRRFIIPAETNFLRLHDTIQYAMGWEDYHLHQFEFSTSYYKIGVVLSEEEMEEHNAWLRIVMEEDRSHNLEDRRMYKSYQLSKNTRTRLPRMVQRFHEFTYEYDYGDEWMHDIQLMAIVDDYPYPYPMVTE